MELTQLRTAFEHDGFVAIPGFLGEQQIHELTRACSAHYREDLITNYERPQFMDAFACDVIPWDPVTAGVDPFIALHRDKGLATITKACVGSGYQDPSSLVMYSQAGGSGQSWHQDAMPDEKTGANINRLFYINDVEEEDGALVVVPGSHKMGLIPAGGHQDAMPGEQIICPRAGTLLLVHGWCFHRVLPNISNKPRLSINFRVFPKGVQTDVTGTGVYRNGIAHFRQGTVNMRGAVN